MSPLISDRFVATVVLTAAYVNYATFATAGFCPHSKADTTATFGTAAAQRWHQDDCKVACSSAFRRPFPPKGGTTNGCRLVLRGEGCRAIARMSGEPADGAPTVGMIAKMRTRKGRSRVQSRPTLEPARAAGRLASLEHLPTAASRIPKAGAGRHLPITNHSRRLKPCGARSSWPSGYS
jgi:hypothetical protein